ncbi:MAG TPA: ferritin-like domain-containing protein [Amycolatopsis sp.]|nr:ferritin-like domain-containing protein [Amycolatopsis sp.]
MTPRTRREILRASALAALALPLAACQTGYSDQPDPLAPLADQARADAEAAKSVAGDLAQQVAAARTAQAQALQTEVDRLNRPASAVAAVQPSATGMAGLKQRLATARAQAEALVPTLPRYRVGLVAAVAAGCAGLQEVSDQLGPGTDPAQVEPPASPVSADAVAPLQTALQAEQAAVWVYSLVSAFLSGAYVKSVNDGMLEHQSRRDALLRMLTAAGATPAPAEPAYVPPSPVTDSASAKSLVVTAESDTTAAWRAVLEQTDDARLRGIALNALLATARRGTRWRVAAGETPAAVSMPGGQPT